MHLKESTGKSTDYGIAVTIIFFMIIVTASFAVLSPGSFGGEDNISHFKIARYAFRYHSLFIDQWGKPVFTILASPFAQFGFNGIRIFNIIISSLTCWFGFLTIRKFKIAASWSVVVLTWFAPLYLVMSYSGMTEIVFGFLIVVSIWSLAIKREVLAVVLLSLLPFARSEGFVIWIPVIAALIIRKRYLILPYFIAGTLFFSITGAMVTRDPLWIIHNFPYGGAADIYGHGDLLHFVRAIPGIFGIPLVLLSAAGIIFLFVRHKDLSNNEPRFFFLWFVILPAIIYFAAHSFVWWRGIGSSAGLTRVMAGIIPLVAMTGALGIDLIVRSVGSKKFLAPVAVAAIMLLTAVTGLSRYPNPTPLSPEQELVKEATSWLERSDYSGRMIYYYNPYVFKFLRLDPYDNLLSREKVYDPENPWSGIGEGEIVIWDSHFGPNEGRLPLGRLTGSPRFREIASFGEEDSGNSNPGVVIFVRLPG